MTKEDLEKSFKFAVNYHLDPKKTQSNRTTGQTRGLGGVIDSFLLGKIVELGIVKILKKFNSDKEYELDFLVHDASDLDPDIVEVKEKGKSRKPRVFVEIKNSDEGDRWVGLTEEQFATVRKNEIVGDDLENIFMVYASLKSRKEKSTKKNDLMGVFLKSEIKNSMYGDFSDIENLYVEVSMVITAKELGEKGSRFEKGYYFYETEMFPEVNVKVKQSKILTPVEVRGNTLLKFEYQKSTPEQKAPPFPERFGDISFSGKIELYKKENKKSNRMYIHCITDVEIQNEVVGKFILKKGNTYEYKPSTVGRNPQLNRNNIWIAKRNILNIIKKSPEERLKEIAKQI